ncbi:filamentous hemagglutinin N-terminal domain-containing protein [Simkania negevensis]|uniref:Filamentous hemagglutinin N-terminal domain-containing protein n=1 Tax=Simkania negevensis TaxID=83561 RepID=A0ABS3AS82_9BACT|nr:filamentous hemagglutinin N-terminal domain-containing protein [Simkania negevensis]
MTPIRGTVSVSTPSSLQMVIEASDNSIIHYDRFDISAQESVQFIQPDLSSRVLNRVFSADPSRIDGMLSGNGQVYLVNPSGIIFASSSVVNVGSLHAAAGSITDEDFLNRVDQFSSLSGVIESEGVIQANAVHLLGKYVSSSGVIYAPFGVVTITVGDDLFLGVENSQIYAKIETQLEANGEGFGVFSVGDIYAFGIYQSGKVEAAEVFLTAPKDSEVIVSGKVDVSNLEGVGGEIRVFGEKISLMNAKLDASGSMGGGEIYVGGYAHGLGGDGLNALHTYVDDSSLLSADGYEIGDGGRVVIWADGSTYYRGQINARGGATFGDGGFAEVSGKGRLYFRGDAELSAAFGRGGTLLLDPTDITITDGSGGTDDSLVADGSLLDFVEGPGSFTISEQALEAIGSTTNIVLEATNDITINDLSDNELNLKTAAGYTVTFTADSDFSGAGDVRYLSRFDVIKTAGGAVVLSGYQVERGGVDTAAGSLNITAIDAIAVHDVTSGTTMFSAGNGVTIGGDLSTSGPTILNGDSMNTGIITADVSVEGSVDTNNNTLDMAFNKFYFDGTSVSSGTALMTMTAPANKDFNLGTSGSGVYVPGTVLQKMTAGSMTFFTTSTGDIYVDGLTAADTANINLITLSSADNVLTQGTSSVFANALTIVPGTAFLVNEAVSTNNSALNITSSAISFGAAGSTNSGTAVTTITSANNGDLTLGTGSSGLVLSGTALEQINTTVEGGVTFVTTAGGDLYIDGLTAANTTNIVGRTTLASADKTLFQGTSSVFANGLTVSGMSEIATAGLTVNSGGLTFNGIVEANGVGIEVQTIHSKGGSLTFLSDVKKTTPRKLILIDPFKITFGGDVTADCFRIESPAIFFASKPVIPSRFADIDAASQSAEVAVVTAIIPVLKQKIINVGATFYPILDAPLFTGEDLVVLRDTWHWIKIREEFEAFPRESAILYQAYAGSVVFMELAKPDSISPTEFKELFNK